jgi:molecular chaperone DnaK
MEALESSPSDNVILGIDLGTTNSLVSIFRNGQPELIVNSRGSRMLPSVVSFRSPTEALVGELARNQLVMNSDVTVATIKRHIGTEHTVHIHGQTYSPAEISALILRKIKNYAEDFLGHEVREAIVTVPAYFDDNQRQQTKVAGEMAGLRVLRLLNEPTAAALAYGYARGGESNLLVVDLGGGTLDITMLEYRDRYFAVKGVGGSTRLGGMDFDQKVVRWLANGFKREYSIDLRKDSMAYQQLLIHSEKAKVDLSTVQESTVMIPYISVAEQGPLHLNRNLTRRSLEKMLQTFLKQISTLIDETFTKAELAHDWAQSIILVGGATRVPAIERLVREKFPNAEIKKDLNPDEVVALGAGVLAGILSGQVENLEFLDITSRNLGLREEDGTFVTLIAAGTPYPCESSKLVTTTKDQQNEVIIDVMQNGNQEESNHELVQLGRFHLHLTHELPAGEPNINVTFSIDQHGLLNVTAVDQETGEKESITITDNVAKPEQLAAFSEKCGRLTII